MLIRLVYQKCIKNGLTGNDIPSHLLYCLASRNTRNLWMMTSHSKKKRESRKVDQKQERWTRKVDQKGGPETREAILQLISENASITSRKMANRLNINRSAISKHLKRMQDDNMIRREGSQKSGRWIIIQ